MTAAAVVAGGAEPRAAGTITPVRTTVHKTRANLAGLRMPEHGSRRLLAVAVAVLALATAGCGGGDEASGDEAAAAAREVEKAIFGLGTTQLIDCVGLGAVAVNGVERLVARCSFEEEESGDGSMRARAGCFVAEEGRAVDVTRDVPETVDCVTSP
jgi:hypothetical protein